MNDYVEAHPLHWPVGRQRAKRRNHAQFQTSLAKARDHLMNEIRLLGGRQPILSSNLELRQDGLPYANQKTPDDAGAAVYFTYKGKQHCFACDDWLKPEDNIRAIGKTIEALRGIARWGTGDMIERAFQGFVALPGPADDPWWPVLGYTSESDALENNFQRRAKELAQKYHPDKLGGDEWKFTQVMKARDSGRALKSL